MSGYLWRGKPDLERINEAIMKVRPPGTHVPPHVFRWGVVQSWPSNARHGRRSGLNEHLARGEKPCPRCAELAART